MPLAPGTRLGVYEITAPLGAGGMGEVYRARDTKLDRDVAIKILPETFAHDPERVARFQREAKTLASLNHPNIGGIYGLEDTNGVTALVLELVEGPTLADVIAPQSVGQALSGSPGSPDLIRSGLQVAEALPIARQIAEALEAAHEQGIIHRDLKPANIKLKVRGAPPPRTEDGRLERSLSAADVADCTVKVLDFGLAKALERDAGAAGEVSQSPTLSVAATRAGFILGTAAYMSPEQARAPRCGIGCRCGCRCACERGCLVHDASQFAPRNAVHHQLAECGDANRRAHLGDHARRHAHRLCER